ncbi:coatomer subunit beta', partial [Pancytospora philotis]
MELQTKAAMSVRTPRVKCIASADGCPQVLVCLYTGEIQLYDAATLKLARSAQIGNVPVRTGVLVLSQDWILLGTDEGRIVVVDLGNLSVSDSILAHDDFVRRIVVDERNKRLLTVSDDNTVKLWSFEGGKIAMVRRYKGKHFMMDAAFVPSDHSLFVAVSLDGRAYLYSTQHEKALKVFKGHLKGINCVAFIGAEYFVTGSDDHTLIVWDYKRGVQITCLAGHTNNVNGVFKAKHGFASCSEDNTVRIWNDDFKVIDIKNVAGRAWAFLEKSGKAFLGSDEALAVYLEQSAGKVAAFSDTKLFYSDGCAIRSVAIAEGASSGAAAREGLMKDIGAAKDVGSLEEKPNALAASPNGKLLAALYDGYFSLYSVLGLRKKVTAEGCELRFAGNDDFVFRNGSAISLYSRLELAGTATIEGLAGLLYADENILVINDEHTCVLDREELFSNGYSPACVLHRFDFLARSACCVGDCLVLMAGAVAFYDSSFACIGRFERSPTSFCVCDEMLFYSTVDKTYYAFVSGSEAKEFSMQHVEHLIGARHGMLYFMRDGPLAYRIDADYISFQKATLQGEDCPVPDDLTDKAISFYESLGMHAQALGLCKNENQRFEILLRLRDFDAAFKAANSPIKFQKLGREYLAQQS